MKIEAVSRDGSEIYSSKSWTLLLFISACNLAFCVFQVTHVLQLTKCFLVLWFSFFFTIISHWCFLPRKGDVVLLYRTSCVLLWFTVKVMLSICPAVLYLSCSLIWLHVIYNVFAQLSGTSLMCSIYTTLCMHVYILAVLVFDCCLIYCSNRNNTKWKHR